MTDLFRQTELICAKSIYRTLDGSFLGKVILTSGTLPEKEPWHRLLYARRPTVGGLAIMRIEDADGKPLLTLRGSQGMCDVRDLNGKTIGHLGLLSGTVGEVLRSRFLSGLLPGYRAWSVRDKVGNVLLRIVPGEGIRTIGLGDGTQVAVWKGDRLTVAHQLPSPLRELVIAIPAAARLVPDLAP
ncbi:hypothetical protein [Actinoplanes sp. ATCC 53533]|uniref:hypothetical protein n=1 Tax=Actinoplanes sp. ATCC 53533 TaxID=1288362 RepID=UPI000F7B9BCE|nr:hypothetical protein [Actinoplanes sp. ATCC 53533]